MWLLCLVFGVSFASASLSKSEAIVNAALRLREAHILAKTRSEHVFKFVQERVVHPTPDSIADLEALGKKYKEFSVVDIAVILDGLSKYLTHQSTRLPESTLRVFKSILAFCRDQRVRDLRDNADKITDLNLHFEDEIVVLIDGLDYQLTNFGDKTRIFGLYLLAVFLVALFIVYLFS